MRSRPRFEQKPERPLKRLFFPIRQRQRGLGRSPCRDARRSSRRGVKSESCRPQPRWLDPPMIGKQVFFDPTGERALVLRWLAWVAGTLSALVVVVFVAILMIVHRPINDSFDDRLAAHASIRCAWAPTCSAGHGITVANAADPELLRSAAGLATELREQERTLKTRHPQAEVLDRHPVPAPLRGSNQRSLSIGFYVNLGPPWS